MNESHSSETPLPLDQVLHERLVEAHTGIHGDVVYVCLCAFRSVEVLKVGERLKVIGTHASRIDGKFLVVFHVLKLDHSLEREVNLGFIEDVKENDLVSRVPQVMEALQHRFGLGHEVAEQNDEAFVSDHDRQQVE